MSRIKVVHIVNNLDATGIPFEMASKIDSTKFKVFVISFYGSQHIANEKSSPSIEVYGLAAKGKLDIIKLKRLYKILQTISPDILHTHYIFTGSLSRLIAKFGSQAKIVNTEHNDHKGYSFISNLFNVLTLPFADAVICNSHNTCNSFYWWEDTIISNQKKTTIYNGIDIGRIDAAQSAHEGILKEFGIKSQNFILGNVAMLNEQKDHSTLIKAFARCNENMPSSYLIIVGSGGLRGELEDLANNLGVRDKVIFTGLLERDQVYKILHNLDVFVMTSRWEGFCNAIAEAMAAKVPVVVSDIQPLPEVVGKAGEYASPQDDQSFAEAIELLYREPDYARVLGKKGRRRVEKKFTLQKSVNQYMDLYESLLNVESA